MSQPTITVNEFIFDSFQIISAATPTVPLHGNDLQVGLNILNRLMDQYSATGLMITVSQQVDYLLSIGQGTVTNGNADYVPTPDINPTSVPTCPGRLANLINAWITLDNVTYPLIDESRTEFWSSYKYAPLMGLPRYIIIQPQTNLTVIQVYPGPSQPYLLSLYAKWQLPYLTLGGQMGELPTYYFMYLQFALAKYLAVYKARMEAWTPQLEGMFRDLEKDMIASSSTNLDININNESWLNGAWRVRAGI
jgi:hypothetical protein